METDILGGVQLGFRTVLVLSGGAKIEDLSRFAYAPDVVIDSVATMTVDFISQQREILASAKGWNARLGQYPKREDD